MSFSFGGPPKTTTAFALPTSTTVTKAATTSAPTLQFSFGGATPSPITSTGPSTGLQFNFGGASTTPANANTSLTTSFTPILAPASAATNTGITFGTPAATVGASTATFGAPTTTFGTPTTTFGAPTTTFGAPTTTFGAPTTTFGVPTTTTAAAVVLGQTASVAPVTTSAPSFPSRSIAASNVAPTVTTTTTTSIPATGSLTFVQLEDLINKWTIDLEEQGKYFVNQAKQLNAWDTLLISNGEKILNLNSSIERVKQQQSQLDQELDFILAQQKELEELIVPLEKELVDVPVTDIDRNQMYQFAEIIDSQLKQISDDLKEIIENINETNKDEEVSNPITQISKILNAHMNSLQWIDRNTAEISRNLEEISKIEDANRRNLSLNSSLNLFQ
ncbi:nuclear pore glycoprotein p62 [Sitophilus oryzae]|uniref:Nuclear pore glycoprotein p62 n=1 Tax=Sitophilus oryzae TaxID=7048 RepID=A0A6J2YI76_SITOR|nr:nuclear pore glycoprotein p62 [Sitophilus oryzae]